MKEIVGCLPVYWYTQKSREFGSEPKIQANDVFIETKGIIQWVNRKSQAAEFDRDAMTVSLKVDDEAKRGLIADVETELRKANARKILILSQSKA